MKTNKLIAFLLGVISGAIATWFQPYNELEIYGVDYRAVMAISALLVSFLFKHFSKARTYTTGVFVGFGVVAALFLRILVDVLSDSTDHNLWPLEVAIFVVIAFPSALIGAYLAELLQWSRKG